MLTSLSVHHLVIIVKYTRSLCFSQHLMDKLFSSSQTVYSLTGGAQTLRARGVHRFRAGRQVRLRAEGADWFTNVLLTALFNVTFFSNKSQLANTK